MSLLEGSLARPPFEALSQVVRNTQKIVLKDLTTASASAKALHAQLSKSSTSPASLAAADKSVTALIATITALKRRLEDTEKAAWKAGKALAVRLEYLRQIEEREGGEGGRARRGGGGAGGGRREGEKKELAGVVGKGDKEEEEEDGEGGPMLVEEVGNGHRNGRSNGVQLNGGSSPTSHSAFSLSSIPSLTPCPTPSTRLHRILLDYLLRTSYYRTAHALSTHLPHLSPLSDMDAFLSARRVLDGLKARDVSRALAWCGEYRSRLRSVGSSMEFELRVQEMMELVKRGEREAGLEYARKWLGVGVVQGRENGGKEEREEEKEAGAGGGGSAAAERGQWEDPVVRARMKKLQEAMTAVMFFSLYHPLPASASAVSSGSSLPPLPPSLLPTTSAAFVKYSHFWSDARWTELEMQFRITHLAVHGLPPHSTLATTLYLGLATLKTPYCQCPPAPTPSSAATSSSSSSSSPSPLSSPLLPSSFSPSSSCPLCCSRPLFELSAGLPSTQRSQSALVCRLSGAVMDGDNPPLVLPNGCVYSRRALQRMAAEHGGLVTCARTHDKFTLDECKAAFVL